MTTVTKRDAAHDPRKAPGAKAKAAKMKAKSRTFDKKLSESTRKATKPSKSNSGPMGSGLLENARRGLKSGPGKLQKALDRDS